MIKLKRAYDPVSPTDGIRLLVERLWPRGLSKEKLKLDSWIRGVGPTTELRKWSVTIRQSGQSFALATFESSTPDRSRGGRSFHKRDAVQ
jgi:uncharacterized protein YeaO (DUF488 family)